MHGTLTEPDRRTRLFRSHLWPRSLSASVSAVFMKTRPQPKGRKGLFFFAVKVRRRDGKLSLSLSPGCRNGPVAPGDSQPFVYPAEERNSYLSAREFHSLIARLLLVSLYDAFLFSLSRRGARFCASHDAQRFHFSINFQQVQELPLYLSSFSRRVVSAGYTVALYFSRSLCTRYGSEEESCCCRQQGPRRKRQFLSADWKTMIKCGRQETCCARARLRCCSVKTNGSRRKNSKERARDF